VCFLVPKFSIHATLGDDPFVGLMRLTNLPPKPTTRPMEVCVIPEGLHEMKELERVVSRQRAQIHRRIEYLRGTGALEPGAGETLERLTIDEREISSHRHELHERINALDPSARPASRRHDALWAW